jgi:hypothetical protein
MVGIKSDDYSIHMEHYKPRIISFSASESDDDSDGIDFMGSGSDSSEAED